MIIVAQLEAGTLMEEAVGWDAWNFQGSVVLEMIFLEIIVHRNCSASARWLVTAIDLNEQESTF